MFINVSLIRPNPQQPRKSFDEGELQVLADSIKAHGVLNPISVEEDGDHYILIDGERRWRAAQMAGLDTIEASIRPHMNGAGERNRLTWAVVANIQHADMSPLEQAKAFWQLRQQGFSTAEIAQQVGISNSMVNFYLNLLNSDDEIQDLVHHRELPFDPNMLKDLRMIDDPDRRIQIARTAASQKMSGPAVCRMIKRMRMTKEAPKEHKKPGPKPEPTPSAADRRALANGHWNMIAQLGYKPALPSMAHAAEETCKNCQLYDVASNTNCRDCPAVELLKRLTFNG